MARSMSSRSDVRAGSGPRRVLFDEVQDGGVGDEAALDDLGHAGNDLVPGQGVQRVQVRQDAGGRVEGAHQVLAFGGVDAGFAAHGGVHHAQQAGGHVDDFDAAEPGGRNEAGEVGHGAAADGDDGVGAGEVVLSQHLPAEGGHLDVLAFFGVRDFGRQRGEAGGGELLTDGVAGEPEGAGVDDEDALDPLAQQGGKACQEATAHHDVVVLRRRIGR